MAALKFKLSTFSGNGSNVYVWKWGMAASIWLLSQIATNIDHVPVLRTYAASQCGVEGIQPCVLPETVVGAVVAGADPRVPSATQVVKIVCDVARSFHVHAVRSQQGVRVQLIRQLQARHRTKKVVGHSAGGHRVCRTRATTAYVLIL